MYAVPSRVQTRLIAAGYASLLLYAAFEWYIRYLAELQNPVDAQGGMWAFGDELLTYYLFFLFLFPTFFLLRLIRTSETIYTGYSKFALAVTITAPLSVALLAADVAKFSNFVSDAALMRLFRSPMVIVLLILSRIFARPKLAKRLVNCAILTEILSLIAAIAIFLFAAGSHVHG